MIRSLRNPAVQRILLRSTAVVRRRPALVHQRSMVVVTQTKPQDLKVPQQQIPTSKHETETMTFGDDIIITASCWNRLLSLASHKQASLDDWYLRVYVDSGGCSGFTYVFELDQEEIEEDEDHVFQGPQGARVVIDDASLQLVKGSTIDFVQEMIKSSFEVRDNPQSEAACGCGSSFAVKNFSANPAID